MSLAVADIQDDFDLKSRGKKQQHRQSNHSLYPWGGIVVRDTGDSAIEALEDMIRAEEEALFAPDPFETRLSEFQASLDTMELKQVGKPDEIDKLTQELVDADALVTDKQFLQRLAEQELREQEYERFANAPLRKYARAKTTVIQRLRVQFRTIATRIAIGALGAAGVWGFCVAAPSLGIMSAATAAAASSASGFGAAGFGLSGWASTLYASLRVLGWDRVMIKRLFTALKQNHRLKTLGQRGLSKHMRVLLQKFHVPASFTEASLATMSERFVSEGIALTSASTVASYVLNAGMGVAVQHAGNDLLTWQKKKPASSSRDAQPSEEAEAISRIGVLRSLVGQQQMVAKEVEAAQGNVFIGITNIVDQAEASVVVASTPIVDHVPMQTTIRKSAKLKRTLNDLEAVPQMGEPSVSQQLLTNSNALRVGGMIASTVALALVPGQVAGIALGMAQSMAMSAIVQKTGVTAFVGKFAGVLSKTVLRQLIDLERPLISGNAEQMSSAQRVFFALLLGENSLTREQVDGMSISQVRDALGQAVSPEILKRLQGKGASVWRRTLLEFQQKRFNLTRGQLIEAFAEQVGTSVAGVVLADGVRGWIQSYASTLATANANSVVVNAAGVTPEEQNALLVASSSPEFQKRHMTPELEGLASPLASDAIQHAGEGDVITQQALQSLRKLNAFMSANPAVAAELSLAPDLPPSFRHPQSVLADAPLPPSFQHPQSLLSDAPLPLQLVGGTPVVDNSANLAARAQLDAIRTARRAESVAHDTALLQVQIGKMAARLQWSPETVASIQTRSDLQRAIQDVDVVVAQPGIGTRQAEMGSLTEEQMVPRELLEKMRQIEFEPLYRSVRDAAVESAAGVWIPGYGYISTANRVLDIADGARHTWNLGVAVNELLGIHPGAKASLGYLPFGELPRFMRASEILNNFLPVQAKLNAKDIIINNLIKQVQFGFDTQELVTRIAADALGADALKVDIDRVTSAMGKATDAWWTWSHQAP